MNPILAGAIWCALLAVVVVGVVLFWYEKPKPDVRVHPEILDEEQREQALVAFRPRSWAEPAAKGIDRARLDNLVELGDSRRAGR